MKKSLLKTKTNLTDLDIERLELLQKEKKNRENNYALKQIMETYLKIKEKGKIRP